MGRDLLYKPPVPFVLPEEEKDKVAPVVTDKLGLKKRGRDLGGTQEPRTKAPPSVDPAPQSGERPPQVPEPVAEPAFKSAYFTKDVEATAVVNQRASTMQALRGAQGATDLKKVVLPASETVDTLEPAQLRAAGELMGLGVAHPDLQGMLARQSQWVRQPHVTVEMLRARLQAMEGMVADRMHALARMARLPQDRLRRSVTLAHAAAAADGALDDVQDVSAQGNSLARDTEAQAGGMHRRIAKTLGIKLPRE